MFCAYTRPRYQASVYRTISLLVRSCHNNQGSDPIETKSTIDIAHLEMLCVKYGKNLLNFEILMTDANIMFTRHMICSTKYCPKTWVLPSTVRKLGFINRWIKCDFSIIPFLHFPCGKLGIQMKF